MEAAEREVAAGDFVGALAAVCEAVRVDERHSGAWHLLARLHLHAGRRHEALGAATRASRLAPHDAQAHFTVGRACKARGDVGAAICHYRESLALDPRNAEIAVRIATDGECALDLSARIAGRSHLPFERTRVAREFERFLLASRLAASQ